MAQAVSLDTLLTAAGALRQAAAAFDPAQHSPAALSRLVEAVAAAERACTSVKVLAVEAAGVEEAQRHGFVSSADWLAQRSGVGTGAAKAALATAGRLEKCPATASALRHGQVSWEQARHITLAEEEAPGSECSLLRLSEQVSFAKLKERCRARRHEAQDPRELHRRQHAARRLRVFRNDLGNTAISGELPPEWGVPFTTRLERETDRIWRAAHRRCAESGEEMEAREAYAADAFAKMMGLPPTPTDGAPGSEAAAPKPAKREVDMVIVCDLNAWRRGHAHPGEVCHVIDGGPLPVEVAKELGRDAFLKAVLHTGTEIHTVAHFGRHIPAVIRTALDVGAAPQFTGSECTIRGCGRRMGLEIDHLQPVAGGGVTSLRNVEPKCGGHHIEKTKHDYASGRIPASAERPGRAPRPARRGPP